MLEQILMHLNNWFVVPDGIHEGTFEIKDGGISLPFLKNGQYFRICGSVFNDGLHQYQYTTFKDEFFSGEVWALAIPKSIILLSEEISEWQEKNGESSVSTYQSESFGGYSYSKATDSKTGGAVTWQSAFRNRLNAWRKL